MPSGIEPTYGVAAVSRRNPPIELMWLKCYFLGNEEYEGSTEYDLDDYAWTTQSTSTQQYIIEKYTVPNTGINYGDIPVMPGHAIPPMYTSAAPTVAASSSLIPVTTTTSIVLNSDQKKARIQK